MMKILIIFVLVWLTEFPAVAGAVENQFAGSANVASVMKKSLINLKHFQKCHSHGQR